MSYRLKVLPFRHACIGPGFACHAQLQPDDVREAVVKSEEGARGTVFLAVLFVCSVHKTFRSKQLQQTSLSLAGRRAAVCRLSRCLLV
jgi:hypothetical protein